MYTFTTSENVAETLSVGGQCGVAQLAAYECPAPENHDFRKCCQKLAGNVTNLQNHEKYEKNQMLNLGCQAQGKGPGVGQRGGVQGGPSELLGAPRRFLGAPRSSSEVPRRLGPSPSELLGAPRRFLGGSSARAPSARRPATRRPPRESKSSKKS